MIGLLFDYFTLSSLLTFLVVLVILYLTYEYRRQYDLPPGPFGLPYIGYALFMDRQKMSQTFADIGSKYKSDIVSVTFFGETFVVINSYELMKEVFQKRTDMADRRELSLCSIFDGVFAGIISTSGQVWKEVRRFSISMLKDFGMGRIGAEERIQNESRILCDRIKSHQGGVLDPRDYMNVAVSNIICGMVFGRRFEHDDPEFIESLKGMNDLSDRLTSPSVFFAFRFTICRKFFFKKIFEECKSDYEKFKRFVKKQIQIHKDTDTGETTDLIYGFLKEMRQGKHPEVFDDTMLQSLILDFFFAGSETTLTSLRWCLLAMAAYPNIQKKVQAELDDNIGDRQISMNDRKLTPYTDAVLCEVQRHFSLTHLGAAHTNLTDDIEINGCRIPKNSMVSANTNEIHHNKNNWKNPDTFDPENFLENGKVANLEKFIPFGVGRRACAGEALARMELYIFFTFMVKEFDIRPETDDTVPDLVGVDVGVYRPKPFKLRMIPRL